MNWQDIFIKARLIVRKKGPYYQNTLLSLAPYLTNEVASIGVTKGLVLVFNPAYIEQQTPEKCAGLFVHEIHHVARKHHKRIEVAIQQYKYVPRIRFIANIAADLTINPDVLKEKWELPEDGVMPEHFGFKEGLILEEYLQLLLALAKAQADTPNNNQKDWVKAEGPASGKCGSVGGNSLGEIEEKADAEAGRGKAEVESIASNQAKELAKTYTAGRGSCPRDVKEAIELTGKSKMPYHRLLGHYLHDAVSQASRGLEGFSKKLPSKKSFVTGIIRAGMIEGIPDVAVIIDTSGSMGKKQLSACLREITGVLNDCDIPDVWLLQADAAVAWKPQKVKTRDLKKLDIHGRGGTAFNPALQALETLRPKPLVAIYFTDGDGAATFKPKGINVIWAVVEARWKRRPEATFGKVVFLPE